MKQMTKDAIGIVRVSSDKQYIENDSPEDQTEQIQRKADSMEVTIKKLFTIHESAAGEVVWTKEIWEYCKDPKIGYAYIKCIDRISRGGAIPYLQAYAEFAKNGVELLDVYGIISSLTVNTLEHLDLEYSWSRYRPTERSEILEAEHAKQDRRDILTKLIGAEARYTKMGFVMRNNNIGYTTERRDTPHGKRWVHIPLEIEDTWMIRIYELRAECRLTDEQIVAEVNKKMGFKTRRFLKHDPNDPKIIIGFGGEQPLTVKQMQRYVEKPIYAGIICEKYTLGEPVQGFFNGLVSIDLWNQANRGNKAIVVEDEVLKIIKGHKPEWKTKRLADNPLYAFRQAVLCPLCKRIPQGSASKNKSGRHIPRIHHSRNHKYWSVNKVDFDKTIEDFVKQVRFTDEFLQDFNDTFLEEWERREKRASDDATSAGKQIIGIEAQVKQKKETMNYLTNPEVIKSLESDISTLLIKQANLKANRNKNEKEQIDLQILLNYNKYFVEHLDDLILGGTDTHQNVVLFQLLFAEKPTYEDLVNRTPKLASFFQLQDTKSSYVALRGVEPRFGP